MCNNNGLCGCLNNNWWWIVILILLLCNCGGWNGCENNNNGCGNLTCLRGLFVTAAVSCC